MEKIDSVINLHNGGGKIVTQTSSLIMSLLIKGCINESVRLTYYF